MEILWEVEGFQFGFKRGQGWAVSKVLWNFLHKLCSVDTVFVTLPTRNQWNIKMAVVAAHLNAASFWVWQCSDSCSPEVRCWGIVDPSVKYFSISGCWLPFCLFVFWVKKNYNLKHLQNVFLVDFMYLVICLSARRELLYTTQVLVVVIVWCLWGVSIRSLCAH